MCIRDSLEAGELRVRHTRILVDGVVIEPTPKTAKGERPLPLPDSLTRVLKRARKRQNEDRLRLGVDYLEGCYVVADEGGSPMHPETLGLAWGRLLDRAGVRPLRLHDARHTCGTLMHLRGVPVAVIAAWLGHTDAAFTMRTYVHSQDDALRSAASVLDVVTSA